MHGEDQEISIEEKLERTKAILNAKIELIASASRAWMTVSALSVVLWIITMAIFILHW